MTSRITKIQEMRKQIAELELVKTRLDNLNVDELPDDAKGGHVQVTIQTLDPWHNFEV